MNQTITINATISNATAEGADNQTRRRMLQQE
jgi:hypothetical protein